MRAVMMINGTGDETEQPPQPDFARRSMDDESR
jgi:hypothetical protein